MPTQRCMGMSREEAFREARRLHSLKGHAIPEKAVVVDKTWDVTYHWSDIREQRRKK